MRKERKKEENNGDERMREKFWYVCLENSVRDIIGDIDSYLALIVAGFGNV